MGARWVRTLPALLRMILTALLPRICAFFFQVGHIQFHAGDKLMKLKYRNYFYNLLHFLIWRLCDRASWQISHNKPTRCTNFSNLFWNKTLHVSDSSSVHHQEFFTVRTAMVYVIQVCWQLASRIRMELPLHPDPARKLSTNMYDI